MDILELLASTNHLKVNKHLIQKLGLHEALLISLLAREYNYAKNNNQLTEDDYFCCTHDYMESQTGLSAYHQREAFKHLEEQGVLQTKQSGSKKYYKLVDDML